MQKIYCYVDETGQDTKGEFFLVSVVIAKDERDNLIEKLEEIERSTGKGRKNKKPPSQQSCLGGTAYPLRAPTNKVAVFGCDLNIV